MPHTRRARELGVSRVVSGKWDVTNSRFKLRLCWSEKCIALCLGDNGMTEVRVSLIHIALRDSKDGKILLQMIPRFPRKFFGHTVGNHNALREVRNDPSAGVLDKECHAVCFIRGGDPIKLATDFVNRVELFRTEVMMPAPIITVQIDTSFLDLIPATKDGEEAQNSDDNKSDLPMKANVDNKDSVAQLTSALALSKIDPNAGEKPWMPGNAATTSGTGENTNVNKGTHTLSAGFHNATQAQPHLRWTPGRITSSSAAQGSGVKSWARLEENFNAVKVKHVNPFQPGRGGMGNLSFNKPQNIIGQSSPMSSATRPEASRLQGFKGLPAKVQSFNSPEQQPVTNNKMLSLLLQNSEPDVTREEGFRIRDNRSNQFNHSYMSPLRGMRHNEGFYATPTSLPRSRSPTASPIEKPNAAKGAFASMTPFTGHQFQAAMLGAPLFNPGNQTPSKMPINAATVILIYAVQDESSGFSVRTVPASSTLAELTALAAYHFHLPAEELLLYGSYEGLKVTLATESDWQGYQNVCLISGRQINVNVARESMGGHNPLNPYITQGEIWQGPVGQSNNNNNNTYGLSQFVGRTQQQQENSMPADNGQDLLDLNGPSRAGKLTMSGKDMEAFYFSYSQPNFPSMDTNIGRLHKA